MDLGKKQYDMMTLKRNIYSLSLIEILKKQHIDADFARNYILNPDYQLTQEEEMITINDVLEYQPHLTREMLIFTYKKTTDGPYFDEICK
uniref:Uncharacterized protein n=1 Tax=viral metagenome TaxID=1070528 RepID=A0A6C0KVN4_9ZZZZ